MVIEKQDEALSILRVLLTATRGVGGNDVLEDILPVPIDSVQDLQELSEKLGDEEYMKKMVWYNLKKLGYVWLHNT